MDHFQFLVIDDRLKGEYNDAKKAGNLREMTRILRELGDLYETYLHQQEGADVQ